MSFRNVFKQDETREFGFGSRVEGRDQRLMNRDGSSNVRRKGLPYFQRFNVFRELIRMAWWKFFTILFSTYLVINLIFASLYYFTWPDSIGGMIYQSEWEKFLEIFFFSAQSLTTVGYGRLNPTRVFDSALASIEAMVGLLGFAVATGLLYGRFSRPVVRLLYSEQAVVAPYRDRSALMLRVAKKHRSELIDIQASIVMSYVLQEAGKPVRKFANLKLRVHARQPAHHILDHRTPDRRRKSDARLECRRLREQPYGAVGAVAGVRRDLCQQRAFPHQLQGQ